MVQSDNPRKPSAAQARAFTPASLRQHVAFWRDELPSKFAMPFTLVHLYDEPDPCPICGGSKKYHPEGSDRSVPCFCQIQLYYRKRIEGWQDYTYLPQRYLQVNPDEILRAERGVTPIRRTQFSMALKAIDAFIANPHGNLFLVGDIGMSRSMLAAYISTHLDPTPNIFITLRQLVDLLAKSGQSDSTQVHDILYRIPVLIIDNFSTTYGDLDNQAAQQLHDLIYYRWSEVLPVVLTTNVPLDDLRAVHGQLLEYLEQDAEVISFDAKQVHMTRSTGGAAVHRETPAPELVQRCPFLGVADGSNSPSSFPSPHNHCLRVAHPQPVALAHQSAACLNEFGGCPVFQTPDAEVVDALPEDLLRVVRTDRSRGRVSWGLRLISVIAAIGVITGLAALGVIVLGPRLGLLFPPEPTESITTEPPSSTDTPVLQTPTVTPATPTSTLVPTESPSPTPNVIMQVTLSLPTNLRQLPEADAPVVALLTAGTTLNVLGRDGLGIWVRVDTLDGQSGWVVVVQIAETIDVVSLPFYTDPTPAPPTVTPASVSTSETPAASGIPASFTVLLIASEISGCNYPDITTDYTFTMTENQLKVTRLVDGTVLEGTFTRANGAFLVSATHSAFAETMSGAITLVGGLIRLRGEHTLSYFDGACGAFYSISGQTSG